MATYDPSQTGNYYILGDTDAETVHLIEVEGKFFLWQHHLTLSKASVPRCLQHRA